MTTFPMTFSSSDYHIGLLQSKDVHGPKKNTGPARLGLRRNMGVMHVIKLRPLEGQKPVQVP